MGERVAILSDVHSNVVALVAVMRDIERKRAKKIYCCGDLIGYGPSPNEVIDIAADNFELVIQGNHDEAIRYKIPKRFKRLAAKAAFWTRQQIKPRHRLAELRCEQIGLGAKDRRVDVDHLQIGHRSGSLRRLHQPRRIACNGDLVLGQLARGASVAQ